MAGIWPAVEKPHKKILESVSEDELSALDNILYAMCEFSEVGDGLKKGHADRHTVCVKINMKRGNKPLQLEQILS